jgi:hypothetical protein
MQKQAVEIKSDMLVAESRRIIEEKDVCFKVKNVNSRDSERKKETVLLRLIDKQTDSGDVLLIKTISYR